MKTLRFSKAYFIVLVLTIASATLWAGGQQSTAAAEKRYVTDPTTGEQVVAPQYGGTITYIKKEESEHMDVLFGQWAASDIGPVVERLAVGDWGIKRGEWNFEFLNPPHATIGSLAESWSQPDPLTYIIKVREGVHWHNKAPMNGRELVAEDIVYNFHRIFGWGGGFTEPTSYSNVLKNMEFESVTATDRYTVVFKLKQPAIMALKAILDDYMGYIYPPEVIEEDGDMKDWKRLVGTGPYELTDWVKGSSLTYKKNPDYWGTDEKYPENRLPYVDEIRGLVMPEVATQLAAMRSGKADYMGVIGNAQLRNVDQVESLRRTSPELVIWPRINRSDNGFGMNIQREPFDDIRVRKAMQMALPLEDLARDFFKGWADPVPQGPLSREMTDVVTQFEDWPEDVKEVFNYDPEGAKKLLAEAGYPDGFKTTMVHLERYDANYSQLIAAYWAEIGVEVDVQVTPLADMVAKRQARNFDMINAEAAYRRIPYTASLRYVSDTSYNSSNAADPAFDALYQAATEAESVEEMNRLSNEMNMWVVKEFWQIFTPVAQQFNVVQPWLAGYNGESALATTSPNPYIFSRLWIDQDLKEEMGR